MEMMANVFQRVNSVSWFMHTNYSETQILPEAPEELVSELAWRYVSIAS
jgi:hypothetical protein